MGHERDRIEKLLGEPMRAAVEKPSKAQWLVRTHPQILAAKTSVGETALHYLAIENCVEAVRLLIRLGAEVDTTDNFGHTPLQHAKLLGYKEMVQVLRTAGRGICLPRTTGRVPTRLTDGVTPFIPSIKSLILSRSPRS